MFTTFKELYPEQVKTPERGYGSKGYKLDIALGESSLREGEAQKTAFARWHQECAAFEQQVSLICCTSKAAEKLTFLLHSQAG